MRKIKSLFLAACLCAVISAVGVGQSLISSIGTPGIDAVLGIGNTTTKGLTVGDLTCTGSVTGCGGGGTGDFKADGTVPMAGNFNLNSQSIVATGSIALKYELMGGSLGAWRSDATIFSHQYSTGTIMGFLSFPDTTFGRPLGEIFMLPNGGFGVGDPPMQLVLSDVGNTATSYVQAIFGGAKGGSDGWDGQLLIKNKAGTTKFEVDSITGSVGTAGQSIYYGDGSNLTGISSAVPTLTQVLKSGASATETVTLTTTGAKMASYMYGLNVTGKGSSICGETDGAVLGICNTTSTSMNADGIFIEQANTGNALYIKQGASGDSGIYVNHLGPTNTAGVTIYKSTASVADSAGLFIGHNTNGYFVAGSNDYSFPAAGHYEWTVDTNGNEMVNSLTASAGASRGEIITVTSTGASGASSTVNITTNNSNADANALGITNTGAGFGAYITNSAASTGQGFRLDMNNTGGSAIGMTVLQKGVADSIWSYHTGTAGQAGIFQLANVDSPAQALQGYTKGYGNAVVGHILTEYNDTYCNASNTCNAGWFWNSGTSGTTGNGSSIFAEISNPSHQGITNPDPLIRGEHHGAGNLIQLSSGATTQTDHFVVTNAGDVQADSAAFGGGYASTGSTLESDGDITTSGSIGIGDSTPAEARLVVRAAGGETAYMAMTATGTVYIQSTAAEDNTLYVNGSSATGSSDALYANSASNSANAGYFNLASGSATGAAVRARVATAGNLFLGVLGSTTKFTVDKDGVVDAVGGYKANGTAGGDACVEYLQSAGVTKYMKFLDGLFIGVYTDSGCTTP